MTEQDYLSYYANRPVLITGGLGFIGSNLVETLLKAGQKVTGLDNFSTGFQHNLDQVKDIVGDGSWKNFQYSRPSRVWNAAMWP